MRFSGATFTAVLLAGLANCALEATEDGEFDTFAEDGKADVFGVAEGSAEARAILQVANTFALAALRDDVDLGKRAAENLLRARTPPLATLAELDAVPYIGPIAFAKLLDYVRTHDLVTNEAPLAAAASRVPWSGFYWSMAEAELALGWDNGAERQSFSEAEARAFDGCIASYSASCVTLLDGMAANEGAALSPLMKFDYYVRMQLEAQYGPGGAAASMYAHATKWELDHHYIGDNQDHRYWPSRGYAGKCIGWALSTRDFDEPTRDVVLGGVRFRPADIKGYLASIYNGAQFFIPEDQAIGNEFHDNPGSDSQAYYDDVHPHEFVDALIASIGQGRILEADLEPGDGVWNYPIHRYQLDVQARRGDLAEVAATIWYADDLVEPDFVSTTDPARPDLQARTLTFELTWPAASDDIRDATGGRWTGAAVDTHPDVVLLELEAGWRDAIYDYRNTEMNTEVNFALIKRQQVGGAWRPIVDDLLAAYYAP